LVRFTRLDVVDVDAMILGISDERAAKKFRPAVQAQYLRQAALIQQATEVRGWGRTN